MKIRLGVNIDHVVTLRQARRGKTPSPVWAALEAKRAGADGIVCHLREDRRHIQNQDLIELRSAIRSGLNLEMAASAEIVRIALKVKPDQATLVPERREELTTEGGLNAVKSMKKLKEVVRSLSGGGIRVSLFLDPDLKQIEAAVKLKVPLVELHTGRYAEAPTPLARMRAWNNLQLSARAARSAGLAVAAGHGLDYENVKGVVQIPEMEELNIGFSIVARALEVGFHQAVRQMVSAIQEGRKS